MPVVNIDWLETASTLQKELADKNMPLRRRTMIDALLRLTTTHARLACLLAAGPSEDCKEDYCTVEDYFIVEMQNFQGTLQRVLGWQEGTVVQAAELEVDSEEVRSESRCSERTPLPLLSPSQIFEGDALGFVGTDSQPSQRSEAPIEDFYIRMKTSLLEDLQDPLVQQLQDPLLDALSIRKNLPGKFTTIIANEHKSC